MERLLEYSKSYEGRKSPVEMSHLENLVEGDPLLAQLLQDVRVQSERFTATVVDFEIGVAEEQREEIDRLNTNVHRSHDALHDCIDVLARNMEQRGKDTAWFEPFADNRGLYTLFAIIITFERLRKQKEVV